MPVEIIGHAIVSVDGKIADRAGRMPPALHSESDWTRFQTALDGAELVVLGRLGHELHPNPGRRRLVLTSRVSRLEADTADKRAMLWNPAGMAFEAVLERFGIGHGVVAVTGGQRVFDFFLSRFSRFDLVERTDLTIPGGLPCFSSGPPGEVLKAVGLRAGESSWLEPEVRLTVWNR